MRVRFDFANYMLDTARVGVEEGDTPERLSPKRAVARARRAVGEPWTSRRTDAELMRIAKRVLAEEGQESADMCQRVLRHLLICGPDAQVH
jgi:hypothetical protein